MDKLPMCWGIIPARYQSSRFPGKPLADIHGKPMFWHVYQRASRCSVLSKVVLATDDERIRLAARELNIPAVMTRSNHPSGTDRILEAAEKLNLPESAVVVNIQGDEPALEPDLLSELVQPFSEPDVQVTTPIRRISAEEAQNPDRVKVVFDKNNRALYFSRSLIPYPRDGKELEVYGHIGIYAFRMPVLRQFVALGSSRLEHIEKLEQLRLLENGIPINIVVTRHKTVGVDRPEDLKIIKDILIKA